MLLEFPGMDLSWDSESFNLYGDGYLFTRDSLRECAQWYASDLRDPFVSPALADLTGLPPALVTTAEYDPVRDGGELFARRMAEAGGDVTLRRVDGVVHGCGEMDLVPDLSEAYRAGVTEFLDRALGRG